MDKGTRTRIGRMTQDLRRTLEDDFASQLQAVYGVNPDGSVHDDHGRADSRARSRVLAALDHLSASGLSADEAVERYVRAAAFTTTNRLVALKLLEHRGLVPESISRGHESQGFKEFGTFAIALSQTTDQGYRVFIDSLFDEIGTEVGVLFDRLDPYAALWPTPLALERCLKALNDPALDLIWREDETLGWVYQFFNSAEERKRMRDESSAPRNSRELAVRNQFFTPRYVVQFLVDNTLGRTWARMNPSTVITAECEFFMQPPDGEPIGGAARKDPRDLRILDPACGSGHFLLYAFDLLLRMYAEAREDASWPASEHTGTALRDDYPTREELNRAAPELILRHNLYGVDIDERAAQIAALALWLRAQRAWTDDGVPASARPMVRRTNVVVAEPMPGEAELVKAFASEIQPRFVGDLFRELVADMALAGEMGTLLPLERTLGATIERGREEFVTAGSVDMPLPGLETRGAQTEFDLSDVTEIDFFSSVERKLIDELERFGSSSDAALTSVRRMFADDSLRGLALLELLRTRFDVVLMNPPFGKASLPAKDAFDRAYPITKNDIYAAFVERGIQLVVPGGMVGALTSRTGFFLSTFQGWREDILLAQAPPFLLADLGTGVLDDAMVEVAAYCLEAGG